MPVLLVRTTAYESRRSLQINEINKDFGFIFLPFMNEVPSNEFHDQLVR